MLKKKLKPVFKSPLILISFITIIPFALIVFLTVWLFLSQRIYPNVEIAGVDVSLLTRSQALQKVSRVISQRGTIPLELELDNASTSAKQQFSVELVSMETLPAVQDSISQAFELGRTRAYFPKVQLNIAFVPSVQIKKQVHSIAQTVNQEPIDSSLKFFEGEITVTPSQNGLILNEQEVYSKINDYLNQRTFSDTDLPLKTQEPDLNFQEAVSIKQRLDEIKTSPIKLTFEDLNFTLDLNTILSLIDLTNSQDSLLLADLDEKKFNISSVNINGREISDSKLTLNNSKVSSYLQKIAVQINRPVQEPLFSVESSPDPNKPKITEFRPPLNGQELETGQAIALLNTALISKSTTVVKLPVKIVEPKNRLTNELGIKELVGRGVSHFSGSIENRKYNIGLAASRINGVLIAPGEEFSFVNTVGDISGSTGYKQAYVIKSGRTVLDDGGGVCQVSTTVFRAALNSGLPITARTAHAYRVGYYEQGFPPGLDATVFSPSVDFKFRNDSPAHVLIQAYVTGNTLTVDLYGTTDGRTVSMTKPTISSVSPAPPEIRQDDPTLPKGTVKQVDFAAAGANVSFSRTVTKGGITYINETFKSNFRPWQAIFLVGTQ